MKGYKVAVIGCGRAGGGLHIPACLDVDAVSDVVICDRSETRLNEVASKYALSITYTNLDKLLENEKPDIAIISTPPQYHQSALKKCLAHGCHVIIEKPLASSVEEAHQMIKTCESYPHLKVMVNENYRWFMDSVAVKQSIENGLIGEPRWIEIRSIGKAAYEDPTFSGWLSETQSQWLFEQGIHWIDLFNYFLDKAPTAVYAQFPAIEKPACVTGNDGLSIVNVSYENGAYALLVQNYLSDGPKESYKARIEGTMGTIVASWNEQMTDAVVEVYSRRLNGTFIPNLERIPGKKQTKGDEFWSGQQLKVMKHFLECIEKDKEPLTNLKEDLKTVKIMFAAYRSREEGCTVSV